MLLFLKYINKIKCSNHKDTKISIKQLNNWRIYSINCKCKISYFVKLTMIVIHLFCQDKYLIKKHQNYVKKEI